MSFRVNTNVAAMNALRNLGITGSEFSKSITRLSTGLRINSAADDPAGLISSESFRAQIAGIDQAIRNNQDAVNYAKTAEGALDEVNRLLRDARSLAVASANSGTLTQSQIQANQNQLNSIVSSITRIAEQTQFGTKKLLDGSAGVSASVTSPANVKSMYFSGTFNGAAITTQTTVTVDIDTAATLASVTGSVTFGALTSTVQAGSFSINGLSFTTSSTTTVGDVLSMINAASGQTGVSATWTASDGITLRASEYGTKGNFTLSDANGVINTPGTTTATGTNAVATVSIDTNGSDAGGVVSVTFTGGQNGTNGLVLSDRDGNVITLQANATDAETAVGSLVVGAATFQIGANSGQTAMMSLGNFAASQLGRNAVANLNLSNLSITSQSSSSDALKVIDAAIEEVAKARGEIGNFQRNVLESNIRSLGISRENLAATESTIRDTDVAQEMTNFTKLQILQQSGLSVLAQANSSPQSVLALLR